MNRKGFFLLDLRPWIRPRCDQCLASLGDRAVGSGDAESAMNPGGEARCTRSLPPRDRAGTSLGGRTWGRSGCPRSSSQVRRPDPSPRSVAKFRRPVPCSLVH
jgi:hypothetical protein